jgi:hypothetical protein
MIGTINKGETEIICIGTVFGRFCISIGVRKGIQEIGCDHVVTWFFGNNQVEKLVYQRGVP